MVDTTWNSPGNENNIAPWKNNFPPAIRVTFHVNSFGSASIGALRNSANTDNTYANVEFFLGRFQ